MTRKARCIRCRKITDSSPELPFFEPMGDGSFYAQICLYCRFTERQHTPEGRGCDKYTPHGAHEFDKYLCCQDVTVTQALLGTIEEPSK